ncbi:ADP-heptose--LPS heptosyltransferase 2 [mine drainage metagenome]|uniref:ADP-heptose--LPS heptosyltransferase 2 n=1 Tax=mine drainage metagenome TaxID=410659 RepID=A0A1J5SGH0_9ZZZZ
MKVDTMRAIDRWVGIPLCFLLTLLQLFTSRRGEGGKPRRILFLELSEMGSTILADPAMRKARQVFEAELFFVIFKRNAASLDFLRTVPEENVYTIREDSLLTLAADTLGFLAWCRRRRIDTVVDLELFSRFTALLTGMSGAANRVGFYRFHNEGLYRGELLTHRVAYNPHIHIAKNFVALINALACPVVETPYSKTFIPDEEITIPRIIAGERDSERMRATVREAFPAYDPDQHRIVLFNPNASELLPQRRWPQSHFVALANQVLTHWQDVVILITGAPDEDFQAEKLKGRTDHPRMVNFAGKVRLSELPTLYELASLMVTNDSGPGHFASVTDMPTIVLFGPETPALYAPLGNTEAITAHLACSPCVSASNHRKTACRDPLCMQAIPPERVFDSIRAVLDDGQLLQLG